MSIVNLENINPFALSAGRDTDALIAEHLMGYRRIPVGSDANGEHGGTEVLAPPTWIDAQDTYHALPRVGSVHLAYFAGCWSTDMRAALELWDHLATSHGWQCSLVHKPFEKEPDEQWVFHGVILIEQSIFAFSAHANTRQLAIARGALMSAKKLAEVLVA